MIESREQRMVFGFVYSNSTLSGGESTKPSSVGDCQLLFFHYLLAHFMIGRSSLSRLECLSTRTTLSIRIVAMFSF